MPLVKHTSHYSPGSLALGKAAWDSLRTPLTAIGYVCPHCRKQVLRFVAPNSEVRITCNCKRCACGERLCTVCHGCEDRHSRECDVCYCELCTDCGEWYNPDKGHMCEAKQANYAY